MAFLAVATPLVASAAAESPRARDLGVPFGGLAGPLNAITDVEGVEVGQITLYTGNGALRVGKGPVRTGVTGTASRKIVVGDETYTVGVLVQCNYNWDGEDLRMGSKPVSHLLPVGEHCLTDPKIERHMDGYPYCDESTASTVSRRTRDGSIIVVAADTVVGASGFRVEELPEEKLRVLFDSASQVLD